MPDNTATARSDGMSKPASAISKGHHQDSRALSTPSCTVDALVGVLSQTLFDNIPVV